jgi:chromosome segregation ATPase
MRISLPSRLQDAMDRSKRVQAMRASNKPTEKTDVIQTYIDHELMVLMSTIDAKLTMQSLMNDRGLLTERLMNLKSAVNKTEDLEEEIRQLEEDLEMRNTQIGDIRAKIMQTDLEAKMKHIPENFSSITELKTAMSYVLRALLETREDFTSTKTKAEDLKITYETAEERIDQLNEELQKLQNGHEREKAQVERDFETKLMFLCNRKSEKILKLFRNKS